MLRRIAMLTLLTVGLAACSASPTTPASSSSSSPTQPTGSPTTTSVTSTLDGLASLPHRIHWQAMPASTAVDHVDFIIDGQLGWTEKVTPYFYGDDGNWLVTSFLKPGKHTFTTKLTTTDGQTAETTTTATVSKAPSPPAALAGKWSRVVTAADATKQTSGSPPPIGRWTLTFNGIGMVYGDPQGGGVTDDVAYTSQGRLIARATIEVPPYPNPTNGAWCHEPDPEWLYTYSVSGKTLTMHAVGKDPCGDRAVVTEGTWTRAA